MKYHFLLIPFLAIGCTTMTSTSKQEKERVEVSMHKIRTDLEEIKHDLNTNQMEMHILEGKLINHEDQVLSIKEEALDHHQNMLADLKKQTDTLTKKFERIEKKQQAIVNDLKAYNENAKETHVVLSQYKEKFLEIENYLKKQHLAIKEMKKVKEELSSLLGNQTSYTVKTGDSLQKIAKKFHVTADALKRANHMKSDLIIAGQELIIPNAKQSK